MPPADFRGVKPLLAGSCRKAEPGGDSRRSTVEQEALLLGQSCHSLAWSLATHLNTLVSVSRPGNRDDPNKQRQCGFAECSAAGGEGGQCVKHLIQNDVASIPSSSSHREMLKSPNGQKVSCTERELMTSRAETPSQGRAWQLPCSPARLSCSPSNKHQSHCNKAVQNAIIKPHRFMLKCLFLGHQIHLDHSQKPQILSGCSNECGGRREHSRH